jgi:hypothetical protein
MEGAVDNRLFNIFIEYCLYSPDRNRFWILNLHYEQLQFSENQISISSS